MASPEYIFDEATEVFRELSSITLVNVSVDLLVFTRIADTS